MSEDNPRPQTLGAALQAYDAAGRVNTKLLAELREAREENEAKDVEIARLSYEHERFEAALKEAHGRLDAAEVVTVHRFPCADPTCQTRIGHRVKILIAERDQLLSLLSSSRAAFLALRAAEDEAARLGEQADVGAVNAAKQAFHEALGRLL